MRRVIVTFALSALVVGATSAPGLAKTDPKADRAIAKTGLLKIGDFPDGWDSEPHEESGPSGLKACRAIEAGVEKNKKYRSSSPDFAGGEDFAQNSVYVFPTTKQAKAFLARYKGSAEDCLRAITESSVEGDPDAEVTVETLDVSAPIERDIVDDGVGIKVTISAPVPGGLPLELVITAVAFRVGRGFNGFTFQSTTEPLPIASDLIDAAMARLTDALEG
jgi:hypothetical protein